MAVVGIDFGYQTSLVAAPRGGGIETLLNDYSKRQSASMVSFGDKQRAMGDGAMQKVTTNPKNTIAFFKTLVGRLYSDPDVQEQLKLCPYRTTVLPDGTVGVVVSVAGGEQRTLSLPQVLAALLGHLRQTSEVALQSKVTDCVISVPIYFSDRQRHALLDAARIAGLNCLRLFNETSAVALSYGIYKKDLPAEGEAPRRVVFVDMGHYGLQMSVCEFVKGKMSVLATAFDRDCGGRHLDLVLVDHFAAMIKDKYKMDVRENKRAMIRLETACEKVKKLMSANTQPIPLNIECLMEDKDVSGRIDRSEFEQLAQGVLARVEACAQRLLASMAELKIALADVESVEVVGGTTRVPAVKDLLSRLFERETLSTTLNQDEAVARGCALQAAIVSPGFRVRDFAVVDKVPFGIDMSWEPAPDTGDVGKMQAFPANSNQATKYLTLFRSAPFAIEAEYSDGEPVPASEKRIGSFAIEGVTPGAEGNQKVKIKFQVDPHGCFHVKEAHMVEKMPAVKEEEMKAVDGGEAAAAAGAEGAATPAAMDESADETSGEKKEGEGEGEGEGAAAAKEGDDKKTDEQVKKKQRTTKTTPLTVVAKKPYVLSSERLNVLVEAELEMANQDRKEVEKSNARNALEEYIYDIRDKLHGVYSDFVEEAARETFCSELSKTEDWLYDEGEDQPKTVYNDRLAELRKFTNPVVSREKESRQRPKAENNLRQRIVHFRKFLDEHAQGDDKYSHIKAEEVEKVAKAVAEKDQWLNEKMAAINAAAKYVDPVVTASQIQEQEYALNGVCNPVVATPKPKAEPPKDEEMKPADGEGAAEAPAAEAPAAEAPESEAADMAVD